MELTGRYTSQSILMKHVIIQSECFYTVRQHLETMMNGNNVTTEIFSTFIMRKLLFQ